MREPYNPYLNRVTLALDRDMTNEEWEKLWSARFECIFPSARESAEEEEMKKEFDKEGIDHLKLLDIANCVRNALRRLSILINSSDADLILNRNDELLSQRIIDGPLDERDHKAFSLDFISVDPTRSENEEASRCFYNTLKLIKNDNREKIEFELTRPFLAYLYIGQTPPSNGLTKGLDQNQIHKLLLDSTVSYIMRNLLHNFVHIRQGINETNYRNFSGPQREDSDFEADNASNYLLLKSFGLQFKTDGQLDNSAESEIQKRFEMTRSNRIFILRSKFRTPEDEILWRLRRSIADRISQKLIILGRTAVSVRIYIAMDDEKIKFNSIGATVNNQNFSFLYPQSLPDLTSENKSTIISTICDNIISLIMQKINTDNSYSDLFNSEIQQKLKSFNLNF